MNIAVGTIDSRSVSQIIMDKAMTGATPIRVRYRRDMPEEYTWHPVAWTQHPYLDAIQFSDGSVVRVIGEQTEAQINERIQASLNGLDLAI